MLDNMKEKQETHLGILSKSFSNQTKDVSLSVSHEYVSQNTQKSSPVTTSYDSLSKEKGHEKSLQSNHQLKKIHRRHQSLPTYASLCSSTSPSLDELIISLKMWKQMLGKDHPKIAYLLNKIGNAHFSRGDFKAAVDSYMEALRCYWSEYDEEDAFAAAILSNIGTVSWRMGNIDEAVFFLEDALRIRQSVTGETDNNAEVASALHSIGIVRMFKSDYEGAIDAFRRALQSRKNIFGDMNIDVSRTIDAIGSVYLMKGETNQAMECHQEALQIKRALLGIHHPSLVPTIMNIGKAHLASGKFNGAIIAYKDALKIQRANMFEDQIDRDIGLTLHTIGKVHLMKGEKAEAMKVFLEALTIYRRLGLNNNDKHVIALRNSTSKANDAMKLMNI